MQKDGHMGAAQERNTKLSRSEAEVYTGGEAAGKPVRLCAEVERIGSGHPKTKFLAQRGFIFSRWTEDRE